MAVLHRFLRRVIAIHSVVDNHNVVMRSLSDFAPDLLQPPGHIVRAPNQSFLRSHLEVLHPEFSSALDVLQAVLPVNDFDEAVRSEGSEVLGSVTYGDAHAVLKELQSFLSPLGPSLGLRLVSRFPSLLAIPPARIARTCGALKSALRSRAPRAVAAAPMGLSLSASEVATQMSALKAVFADAGVDAVEAVGACGTLLLTPPSRVRRGLAAIRQAVEDQRCSGHSLIRMIPPAVQAMIDCHDLASATSVSSTVGKSTDSAVRRVLEASKQALPFPSCAEHLDPTALPKVGAGGGGAVAVADVVARRFPVVCTVDPAVVEGSIAALALVLLRTFARYVSPFVDLDPPRGRGASNVCGLLLGGGTAATAAVAGNTHQFDRVRRVGVAAATQLFDSKGSCSQPRRTAASCVSGAVALLVGGGVNGVVAHCLSHNGAFVGLGALHVVLCLSALQKCVGDGAALSILMRCPSVLLCSGHQILSWWHNTVHEVCDSMTDSLMGGDTEGSTPTMNSTASDDVRKHTEAIARCVVEVRSKLLRHLSPSQTPPQEVCEGRGRGVVRWNSSSARLLLLPYVGEGAAQSGALCAVAANVAVWKARNRQRHTRSVRGRRTAAGRGRNGRSSVKGTLYPASSRTTTREVTAAALLRSVAVENPTMVLAALAVEDPHAPHHSVQGGFAATPAEALAAAVGRGSLHSLTSASSSVEAHTALASALAAHLLGAMPDEHTSASHHVSSTRGMTATATESYRGERAVSPSSAAEDAIIEDAVRHVTPSAVPRRAREHEDAQVVPSGALWVGWNGKEPRPAYVRDVSGVAVTQREKEAAERLERWAPGLSTHPPHAPSSSSFTRARPIPQHPLQPKDASSLVTWFKRSAAPDAVPFASTLRPAWTKTPTPPTMSPPS